MTRTPAARSFRMEPPPCGGAGRGRSLAAGRRRVNGAAAAEIAGDLYWTALSRPPSPEEREATVRYLDAAADRRAALEDVAWALLNAKEFLFRR